MRSDRNATQLDNPNNPELIHHDNAIPKIGDFCDEDFSPRGNLTMDGLKRAFIRNVEADSEMYKRIPDTLFNLVNLYGFSLDNAKTLFIECAKDRHWHLVPASLGVIITLNMFGKQGESRILKWYTREYFEHGAWATHFVVPATQRVSEGLPTRPPSSESVKP